MPGPAKKRLLEAYVDNTDSDTEPMIVGGSMHCNLVGTENLTARIDAPINFHVNGMLSLFASTWNPDKVRVQDIHTKGPYSVLTELISSAGRPARSTPRPLVLKEATPLWNDFIDKASEGDEYNSLVDYIAHTCFYNELLQK